VKIPKYDTFEKIMTVVIAIVSALGFYYASTIYHMAQEMIYEPSIIMGVLLFIILQVLLLNAVLLYSILKGRLK
jgi:hypothetical protein